MQRGHEHACSCALAWGMTGIALAESVSLTRNAVVYRRFLGLVFGKVLEEVR